MNDIVFPPVELLKSIRRIGLSPDPDNAFEFLGPYLPKEYMASLKSQDENDNNTGRAANHGDFEDGVIKIMQKNYPRRVVKRAGKERKVISPPGNTGLAFIINDSFSRPSRISVNSWCYNEDERLRLDRRVYEDSDGEINVSKEYKPHYGKFILTPYEGSILNHEITAIISCIANGKFMDTQEAIDRWRNDRYTGKEGDNMINWARRDVKVPERLQQR